jgi:hypothetical protein
MGSTLTGDGSIGPVDLFPMGVDGRDPGAGTPSWLLLFVALLRIAGGGKPSSLETVQGSSNPAAHASAMYRASSRCNVG